MPRGHFSIQAATRFCSGHIKQRRMATHDHVFYKALVYLMFVWKACGFNVYTKPHIYSKPGPKAGQSFFGYAVTLHSNGNEKS